MPLWARVQVPLSQVPAANINRNHEPRGPYRRNFQPRATAVWPGPATDRGSALGASRGAIVPPGLAKLMALRWKRIKRGLRRKGMSARTAVAGRIPEPVARIVGPPWQYVEMLLLDHLFVRVLFPNRHRLAADAWRAAQPLPYQLRHVKDMGVRTIVNLRGNAATTTARQEQAACQRLGLGYVDFRLRSRDAPTREELHGLRRLFETVEHPVLLHCKSGADRAGLASAIYLHVMEGVPIEEARRQLSLRFGHVRHADTGILDAFFERYLDHAAREPIPFFDWVDRHYDAAELKRSFRSSGWASRIVGNLLRRE